MKNKISWITIYEWKISASNFLIYSIWNENESEHSLTPASILNRNEINIFYINFQHNSFSSCALSSDIIDSNKEKSSFWKWKNRRTASVADSAKFIYFDWCYLAVPHTHTTHSPLTTPVSQTNTIFIIKLISHLVIFTVERIYACCNVHADTRRDSHSIIIIDIGAERGRCRRSRTPDNYIAVEKVSGYCVYSKWFKL